MKRLIKLPLLLLAILLSGVLFSCSEEEEMSPEEKAISLPHLPDSIISWDTITIQKKSDGRFYTQKHFYYPNIFGKYRYIKQKRTEKGDIVEISDSTLHYIDTPMGGRSGYFPDTLVYKLEGNKIKYMVEITSPYLDCKDSTVYEYAGDYLVKTYHYIKEYCEKDYKAYGYRNYIWKNGNIVEINYHNINDDNPKSMDITKIEYNDHTSTFIVPEATLDYYIGNTSINLNYNISQSAWWMTKALLFNSGCFGKRPVNDPVDIKHLIKVNYDNYSYHLEDEYSNFYMNISYSYDNNRISSYTCKRKTINKRSYYNSYHTTLLKW